MICDLLPSRGVSLNQLWHYFSFIILFSFITWHRSALINLPNGTRAATENHQHTAMRSLSRTINTGMHNSLISIKLKENISLWWSASKFDPKNLTPKGDFFLHKMKIQSSFTYLLVVLNMSFFLTEQFMVPFDFYRKGVIKYKIKYCIS